MNLSIVLLSPAVEPSQSNLSSPILEWDPSSARPAPRLKRSKRRAGQDSTQARECCQVPPRFVLFTRDENDARIDSIDLTENPQRFRGCGRYTYCDLLHWEYSHSAARSPWLRRTFLPPIAPSSSPPGADRYQRTPRSVLLESLFSTCHASACGCSWTPTNSANLHTQRSGRLYHRQRRCQDQRDPPDECKPD